MHADFSQNARNIIIKLTCVRGAQGVCSSEIAMSRITSIKRICNMLHVFIVRMYRGYQFLLITSQ